VTPIRVGVIGTGFGVRTLMPALIANRGVAVRVICSARLARAEAAAARFGVPDAVNDYSQLVARDDLDLVCVCTPPALHAEISMAALDAGHHVFSTKPLATSLAEARLLRDRARELGAVNALDFDLRYVPAHRYLRQLVGEGFLGQPRFILASIMSDNATDPTTNVYYYQWVSLRSEGGGILRASLMNHYLDLLRYTFGEIAAFTADVSTVITEKPVPKKEDLEEHRLGSQSSTGVMRPVDAEDTLTMFGHLENGSPFSFAGTWSTHFGSGYRVEAYGSEGTLILEPSGRLLGAHRTDDRPAEVAVPERLRVPEIGGPSCPASGSWSAIWWHLSGAIPRMRSMPLLQTATGCGRLLQPCWEIDGDAGVVPCGELSPLSRSRGGGCRGPPRLHHGKQFLLRRRYGSS
jgi:predicted dehydrogenase